MARKMANNFTEELMIWAKAFSEQGVYPSRESIQAKALQLLKLYNVFGNEGKFREIEDFVEDLFVEQVVKKEEGAEAPDSLQDGGQTRIIEMKKDTGQNGGDAGSPSVDIASIIHNPQRISPEPAVQDSSSPQNSEDWELFDRGVLDDQFGKGEFEDPVLPPAASEGERPSFVASDEELFGGSVLPEEDRGGQLLQNQQIPMPQPAQESVVGSQSPDHTQPISQDPIARRNLLSEQGGVSALSVPSIKEVRSEGDWKTVLQEMDAGNEDEVLGMLGLSQIRDLIKELLQEPGLARGLSEVEVEGVYIRHREGNTPPQIYVQLKASNLRVDGNEVQSFDLIMEQVLNKNTPDIKFKLRTFAQEDILQASANIVKLLIPAIIGKNLPKLSVRSMKVTERGLEIAAKKK